jgi:alkaline phosphatase D
LAVANASFTRNLNFESPSRTHPSLGIQVHKVAKRTDPNSAWSPSALNFTHGVASGDPLEDRVILWARVAPNMDNNKSNATVSGTAPLFDHDNEKYVEKSDKKVCVEWKISETKDFKGFADQGVVYTSSDVDYTIKVRDDCPRGRGHGADSSL